MFVILINGHVGCLKTTIAHLLSSRLSIANVSTSALGGFVAERSDPRFLYFRERRYNAAAEVAECYLRNGAPIILDGTYARPEWREEVYRICTSYGVTEVVAVTCTCSIPEVVRSRLEFRQRHPNAPDAAANQMQAYWGSVEEYVPLDEDRVPPTIQRSEITVDTGALDVHLRGHATLQAQSVALAIERAIAAGSFAQPIVADGSRLVGGGSRLCVELEGIGGSGKSTQAALLQQSLGEPPARLRIRTSSEFSRDSLGAFLRMNTEANFRLRVAGADSSAWAHLLALGDAYLKGGESIAAARWDVLILDRYRWTHMAHAQALVAVAEPSRTYILRAVELLSQALPPLAGTMLSIVLDCSPEVAAERIAKRRQAPLADQERQFLHSLHHAYREICARNPSIYRVDADRTAAEVTHDLRSIVLRHIGPSGSR